MLTKMEILFFSMSTHFSALSILNENDHETNFINKHLFLFKMPQIDRSLHKIKTNRIIKILNNTCNINRHIIDIIKKGIYL